jgi:hypothetical protein
LGQLEAQGPPKPPTPPKGYWTGSTADGHLRAISPLAPKGKGVYPIQTKSGIRWKDAKSGRFTKSPETGKIALGHYRSRFGDGYIDAAKRIGADWYEVPASAWSKISRKERWAMNRLFIDEAMKRGDDVFFATGWESWKTYYGRELRYLRSKGVDISRVKKQW